MDDRHTFSALTEQLALACGLCTAFYLIDLNSSDVGWYYPLVLLPYAPAIFAVNKLFLRRSRTMRAVVLLNAGAFVLLLGSVLFVEGANNWAVVMFQAIFCLWLTVHAAQVSLEPPTLHSLLVAVDLSAVMLLVFIAYLSAAQLPLFWCAPAAAGCAASLLGLITRRINRPLGPREWGVILLAFAGLFAGMWLLVTLAAAPAGQGLVALWHALTSAVQWAAGLLWRAFLFLLSLFPDPEPGQQAVEFEFSIPSSAEELAEQNSPLAAMILAVALIVLAVTMLVVFLRQLGKLRVGGRKSERQGGARQQSGRISLWQALRRLWDALTARLRLWVFLRRNRDTPEGLFYLLVRRCRLGPWHKRPGETPREFLLRLRATAVGDVDLYAALDGLIPAVDAALYAPACPRQAYPAARLIRRRFGAASRRHFMRRCRDRMRELLHSLKKQT